MSQQQQDESKESLNDYFVEQKVTCFCDTYEDCAEEREADDVYTSSRLRKYFEAYYINGLGDLLTVYVNQLVQRGFLFRTSITGEPAIFVKQKNTSSSISLLL